MEKDVAESESKIEKLEQQLEAFEAELSTPEGAADFELMQQYLDLKSKLDRNVNNWEQLMLNIEEHKLQNR